MKKLVAMIGILAFAAIAFANGLPPPTGYEVAIGLTATIAFVSMPLSGLILGALALTGRIKYADKTSALVAKAGIALPVIGWACYVLALTNYRWFWNALGWFGLGCIGLSGPVLLALALTGRLKYADRRSELLAKAGIALLVICIVLIIVAFLAPLLLPMRSGP